jgi:hypothetical protein
MTQKTAVAKMLRTKMKRIITSEILSPLLSSCLALA